MSPDALPAVEAVNLPQGASRSSTRRRWRGWLGTSVRHVQRLVTEKRIPYLKVGHFIRFDSGDVAQWIESQKVDTGSGGEPLAVTIVPERQLAPTASLTRRPTSASEVLARWQTEAR